MGHEITSQISKRSQAPLGRIPEHRLSLTGGKRWNGPVTSCLAIQHGLAAYGEQVRQNGIDAKGYLDKAEVLFREMGLERDLEELEQVRMRIGRSIS